MNKTQCSARALLEALAVEERVDEGEHLALLGGRELLNGAEPPVEARVRRLRACSSCSETEELISRGAERLGDRRSKTGMSVPTYAYAANNPLKFVDLDGLRISAQVTNNPHGWIPGRDPRRAVARRGTVGTPLAPGPSHSGRATSSNGVSASPEPLKMRRLFSFDSARAVVRHSLMHRSAGSTLSPALASAARASPPEDCGGPGGYQALRNGP